MGKIVGPSGNLTMDLPCHAVFSARQRSIEVAGPALEDDRGQTMDFGGSHVWRRLHLLCRLVGNEGWGER
jgi:hypothetical protein